MEIKAVNAYPVQCKVNTPFTSATGWRTSQGSVLIEVIAEDGLSGWGDAQGPLRTIATAVEDDIAPIIVGQDPLDAGMLWEKMQVRRTKGTPPGVIGAVDMALWDLKGKILNVPVHQLMGGCFHEHVQPYATAIFYHEDDWDSIAALEEEAVKLLEKGFRAIKMKVGFGIQRDIKRISKVREVLGDGFPLMVDANQSYGFLSALELGFALKELDIRWYEEPMVWTSLSAYRDLGERLNIPIAGGEVETAFLGFVEAIRQRAVQIIQPDPAQCGGITPSLHIASLAKAFEVSFSPHAFGTLIGLSATLHLTAGVSHYADWSVVPRPVLLEWDATENPLRDRIIAKGPEVIDGMVAVPKTPGLGVEVDREAIAALLVK